MNSIFRNNERNTFEDEKIDLHRVKMIKQL